MLCCQTQNLFVKLFLPTVECAHIAAQPLQQVAAVQVAADVVEKTLRQQCRQGEQHRLRPERLDFGYSVGISLTELAETQLAFVVAIGIGCDCCPVELAIIATVFQHHAIAFAQPFQSAVEAPVEPKDVDLIAVNIGPGSFTGIRACVTVARVMAQQLNCKATGVSSLEILAKNVEKNPLVALDARKNSAYLYVDGEIKGAVQLEEVKKLIETGKYEVLTDDKLKDILGGESYQKLDLPLGEILANLAEEKSLKDDCNWRLLKPLYIQPPPMG